MTVRILQYDRADFAIWPCGFRNMTVRILEIRPCGFRNTRPCGFRNTTVQFCNVDRAVSQYKRERSGTFRKASVSKRIRSPPDGDAPCPT